MSKQSVIDMLTGAGFVLALVLWFLAGFTCRAEAHAECRTVCQDTCSEQVRVCAEECDKGRAEDVDECKDTCYRNSHECYEHCDEKHHDPSC